MSSCRDGRLAHVLVGAFGGAAIGGALLPGWWGLLPAILGAAVGLAASGDDGVRR